MSGLDYSDCDAGTPWSARSWGHAPCSVVRTRNRAGAGYACSARPDLHTVCRSFPKICDGARRGPWACMGGGGPTRHVCSICSAVRTRDRVVGAGYACSARPDLHTACRSFPKISSALSAKVCGGSRSAKKKPALSLSKSVFTRETGGLSRWGVGVGGLRLARRKRRTRSAAKSCTKIR